VRLDTDVVRVVAAAASFAVARGSALLGDFNICGELLLLGVDDLERLVELSRNARFVTVAALRSVNDGLLVEGLGEDAIGWGMAERLMISGGDGRGGEEGEDELHGWLVDWRALGLA